MRNSCCLALIFTLAFLCLAEASTEQRVRRPDNESDMISTGDLTTNWWWAKFSDVGDKDSCPVEPLSNAEEEARVRRVPMLFERPLRSAPLVLVSVTRLSAENTKRLNYHAQAMDISSEGFTLEFRVFCDTFIDEVEVQWMAIG